MEKHAIANYYDTIDSHLKDTSLNNKTYWKIPKYRFTLNEHMASNQYGIPWTVIKGL